MRPQRPPEQRQISDQVEHLVPRILVGEAQLVVDGIAVRADHEIHAGDIATAEQVMHLASDPDHLGERLLGKTSRHVVVGLEFDQVVRQLLP